MQNKKTTKLSNKRVLVTGGAGFIGSNIVETLLKQDNYVICLDNFSTGKKKNIKSFVSNKNFQLIEGDIRDPKDCSRAVDGIDCILHQAALGSVPRSIKDPKTTNDVNISGFLNMITAAADAKVKRFVYAASSSTYGDHKALPKIEDRIGKPLSPYAVTKYVNELYAGVFADLYDIETVGLRYFNVFGKRQDPEGPYAAVIPKFIKTLIKHEQPVVYGDGTQSRDFTYVDNVVQINQLAAVSSDPEALNTVYNVAFGERTDLKVLVKSLVKLLAKYDPEILKLQAVNSGERKGDVKHSLASIDKAKKLLGYDPKYSFSKGLEHAIKWYWENLK